MGQAYRRPLDRLSGWSGGALDRTEEVGPGRQVGQNMHPGVPACWAGRQADGVSAMRFCQDFPLLFMRLSQPLLPCPAPLRLPCAQMEALLAESYATVKQMLVRNRDALDRCVCACVRACMCACATHMATLGGLHSGRDQWEAAGGLVAETGM